MSGLVTLLPKAPAPARHPSPSSVVLRGKTPRKLAREKCKFCRMAKVKCLPGPAYASGCRRCHQKKLECPGPTKARAPAPAVHPTPCSVVAPVVASTQLSHTGWGALESLDADEDLIPDATHLEQLKHQACLACLALGLKCEMEAPGEVCRQCLSAHHGIVLPARLCMRPVPLAHISVFQWDIPGADGVPPDIWATLQSLDLSHISVSFDVDWDLTQIVADVVGFLGPNQPRCLRRSTSKVGILSCSEFALLLRHQVSAEACFLFHAMLYGTSSVYLRSDRQRRADGLSTPPLAQLAAAAGDRFLRYLDQQLQPAELAAADLVRRQGLFLLVFGTILAVSYAQSNQTVATSSEAELRDAMSTHLCERLAHHLVLLGQSIGAVFDKNEEQVVLRRPLHRWDREGTYSWVNKLVARPLRRRVGQVGKRDTSRSCRRQATALWRDLSERTCAYNGLYVKLTHSVPSPTGGSPRRLLPGPQEAAVQSDTTAPASGPEAILRDICKKSAQEIGFPILSLTDDSVLRIERLCRALRIIKTRTKFLRAEPDLPQRDAPITVCGEVDSQYIAYLDCDVEEPLQLAGLV